MLVEYAEGATGTIDVSGTRMPGEGIDVGVRLHGDEGSLRLEFGLPGGRSRVGAMATSPGRKLSRRPCRTT